MDKPSNELTMGRLVGEELDERHRAEEALRRSEQRYRALVEAVSQAVGSWSPPVGTADFSQLHGWWEKLTGQTIAEQQASANAWLDVVHPEDRQAVVAAWDTAVSSGTKCDIEYRVKARAGGWRYVHARGVPIRGSDGTIREWITTLDDVTERRMAEMQLRQSEARLRRLASGGIIGVIRWDLDRSLILEANDEFLRMTGYDREDLAAGRLNFRAMTPPEWTPRNEAGIRALRETGVGGTYEKEYFRKDGSRVPIIIVGVRFEESPCEGMSFVLDISERKRTEAVLRDREGLLRLATEAAELGIWVWDVAEDRVIWENDRSYEIFGLDRSASSVKTGRFLAEFVHPDNAEAFRQAVEEASQPGGRLGFLGRFRRSDGQIRWVEFKGGPVQASRDASLRLHGTAADVTDRQHAAEALRDAQARLEATLAAGEVATWTWDVATDRVNADRNLARLFGVSEADARAGPLAAYLQAIHPGDRERVRESIQHALRNQMSYEAEFRVQQSAGESLSVIARGRAEYDASGAPIRLPGVVLDVTRLKRAEAERARLTETLGLALGAADLGTWEWDPGTDLITLSDRAAEIYDLPAGQTYPREWMRGLLQAEYRERARQAAARAVNQRAEYNIEYPLDRPGKGPIWVAVRGRGVYDAGGNLTRMLGVVQDITDRKLAEESLRESDRKKDEFLALLAHELRNPLAPLRNGLQVMRLGSGNPNAIVQAQAMMERQLSHMVRLIDDLLDVSRINRNKMELRRARIALSDVVSCAVETARPVIEEAGHDLTVALPQRPVILHADLTRLAQVFCNLLTNSSKYTERGGRIWLSAERGPREVMVSVQDTGIGIPAGSLATIFDMFSQVDRSLERSTGGLGIGLALVKGLVEMHGGTVTAQSDGQGKGSTFTVVLPVLESQADYPGGSTSENGAASPRSKRHILVVDDNRDGADSLAMMLQLLNNDVQTANDGVEAVEVAERFRPDIILMDVGMPRLNGLDATRRIREQGWSQGMRIIALTGWGQEADKERSRQAGCDGHLVKPVDLSDLEKLLKELDGNRSGNV